MGHMDARGKGSLRFAEGLSARGVGGVVPGRICGMRTGAN